MNEVAVVLHEIANQLGIAVKDLWPYMVGHCRVEAITLHICGWILFIGSSLSSICSFKYLDEYDRTPVVVVLIMFFILSIAMISSSISDIMYPEAAAVKEIIGMIN